MPVKRRKDTTKSSGDASNARPTGSNETSTTDGSSTCKLEKKSEGTAAAPSPPSAPPYSTQSIVKRSLIRVVFIAGALIIANYYQQNEEGGSGGREPDPSSLAQQNEVISFKRFHVRCATDQYDAGAYPRCVPASCGRVVSDAVVTPDDAKRLLKMAQAGLAFGGSSGGASILDLHSGALSHGDKFVDVYKLAPAGTFSNADLALYRRVTGKVRRFIADEFKVDAKALHFTHPTFFSRMENKPARTVHDEYWHVHTDKDTYETFDYTALLYLADWGRDFGGGRFLFVDRDTNRTVEPRFARVSAFTSGAENPHFVEPVSWGTRYALTLGFTCDKSKKIEMPKMEE